MQISSPVTKPFILQSIVHAEDDEDDRMIFSEVMLEIAPQIKVEHAVDGSQLTALLRNFRPDLLFLDLEMPRKNGLQCLEEIRNSAGVHKLPVIVFSGTTRTHSIQAAYEMGADLFLVKSALFEEYKSSIKSILQLDWSRPELIKSKFQQESGWLGFK